MKLLFQNHSVRLSDDLLVFTHCRVEVYPKRWEATCYALLCLEQPRLMDVISAGCCFTEKTRRLVTHTMHAFPGSR